MFLTSRSRAAAHRPVTIVIVIGAVWCGVLVTLPVADYVEVAATVADNRSEGSTDDSLPQTDDVRQQVTMEPKKIVRSLTNFFNSTVMTSPSPVFSPRPSRRLKMKKKHLRPPTVASESDNSFSLTFKRLLTGYDKNEPPSRDNPTVVKLGIYVNSFFSISEQTMDYSVSLYLRQQWIDRRLAFETTDWRQDHVRLGLDSWSAVWTPDTFFRNEKSASFHTVTLANRLMRLHRNGTLWYVMKITATLSCQMLLQKYPLDTQTCPIMFESFGYTTDTLQLAWLENPIDIEESMQVPQFTLAKEVLIDCMQNYTAGQFPCLAIHFVFHRDIGFFLIQVYVPSVLIVILSWVSFWINVDASPARVSIGLLTVLTTTTMSGGARATLPKVSYIKAIDVWMIVCLVFVFASLIEYAIVNVIARRMVRATGAPPSRCAAGGSGTSQFSSAFHARWPPKRTIGARETADKRLSTSLDQTAPNLARSSSMQQPASSTTSGASSLCGRLISALQTVTSVGAQDTDGKQTARKIDRVSRKLFPACFVVFNLVYWTFYTCYPFSIEKESMTNV